jgi:16S rRNA G966 N2-methylase RsmD
MDSVLNPEHQQLLSKEVQEFIQMNLGLPLEKVIFQCKKNNEWNGSLIANQIHGRNKINSKIPSWSSNKSLLFPEKISIEQCSSEATALYKSKLASGNSFIDLTGGFGVDSYFMSQSFNIGYYCELNKSLFQITSHNFRKLNCQLNTFNASGIEVLKKIDQVDLIYIDPSRRNKEKKRVFKLEDYSPNIVENLELLLEKSNKIIVKTAPFLDIQQVLTTLPHISEIHAISINNDCKEVLYIIDKNKSDAPQIHCIDLMKKWHFSFQYSDEDNKCTISEPLNYLYEPSTSILKAGAFNSIALHHNISKLHVNSHLYTSVDLISGFQGRKFKILAICKPNKKDISKYVENGKANITKRNFPYSVQELRKKLDLKDGGRHYLFATILENDKKVIIVTEKC